MTKQEKIQEAWIEIVGDKNFKKIEPYIYENGTIEGFVLMQKIGNINDKLIEIFNPLASVYVPKSIQGIEKNNGWIKIESEDDLPKEDINCWWIDKKDGMVLGNFLIEKNNSDIDFILENATHYQPIIKPQPPIY